MAAVVNVNDLLNDHVVLDLECLDRIYLNAYVPNLQTSGQVVVFMRDHQGMAIPSPAVMEKMGNRFRKAVDGFAEEHDIPVIHFKKGDRHIDIMTPSLEAATEPAVVAIGVAQEFQSVFAASRRDYDSGPPSFRFYKADRRVSAYYFYVNDADFGHGFIKICAYFPYPGKVWVNGHEWAKRQAHRAGLDFRALSNGFASCNDPIRLQSTCDRLGPNQISSFFERWMGIVPTPLAPSDRAGGFWWELSMRQVEVSRTIVFDAPRRARAFFEATVADNLDIGRPDEIKLIFSRRIRSDTQGGDPGHRGHDQRVLQALSHQAILEGRPCSPNRDGGEQPHRPRSPAPPPQPRRAGRKGQRGQPTPARDPARRPGLCHRDRSLGADLTALARGGPKNRSVALRGSTRHGPGRCTLRGAQHRRRLHQQEPPCLGVPAARQPLQCCTNDL